MENNMNMNGQNIDMQDQDINTNQNNVNMGNRPNYNQGMQQMNKNMPPNMNNGYNKGYQGNAQDTMNKVFSAITKFTKDIDNILQDFGDKVESVLNSGNISNSTESINKTLEQAQSFGQSNQQGKIMEPVIGRSSIQLSNGNEIGTYDDRQTYDNVQNVQLENTYSEVTSDSNVQNIGQVVNPEIHSILDNKVSLNKNTDSIKESDQEINKDTSMQESERINGVSLKKVGDA